MKRLWILIQALFELANDEVSNSPNKQVVENDNKKANLKEESKDTMEHPAKILTPDMDSEKLLYDDVFMDEAIQKYTLRSLTESLSRIGSKKGVDCHNRAHKLGRRAYELVGGEAFKNCGVECHSGCRHGATEAFFADKGSSDLQQSITLLCGDETSIFGLHQCLHGTGHGLMAWFDYGIHDALKACDLINTQQHRESCYSGIFMENIVGGIATSEEGDSNYHYTEYLNDDPHYPCNILDDKYKGQCYFLQTDRMLQLFRNTKQIGVECSKAPERFQWYCFFSMGRTISGSVLQDPTRGFELCREISNPSDQNICLEGVLNDLLWDETHIERSIFFCSLDHNPSFQERCYMHLISIASNVIPNKMSEFCKQLPDEYHNQCSGQESSPALQLSVTDEDNSFTDIEKTENAIIRYVDDKYIPDTIHISIGQEVVWINEDQVFWPASNLHPTHTAYPGSNIAKCFTSQKDKIFDACKSLGTGEKYSFVFNEIGNWRFHDHINPKAAGTVIVSE